MSQESLGISTDDVMESREDWTFSPEGILQRLEDPCICWDDQLTAVLFAETTAFNESQKLRLLPCLYRFCEDHRFSTDEDTVTAVGAAIRKYAMNMGESDFDGYAELLVPSNTETLSHEIELELVKALGWRLVYQPFEFGEGCPRLVDVLADFCDGYLTRRLILQRNYASTVLHGIVAVAILESAVGEFVNSRSLVERVGKLQIAWFYELLSDRLAEAIVNLAEHRPDLAEKLQNEVAFAA